MKVIHATSSIRNYIASHKWWVIGVIIVLVSSGVVGTYFASSRYWDNYQTAYRQSIDSSKSELDAALTMASMDSVKKLTALKSSSDTLNSVTEKCTSSGFVAWQSLFPAVQSRIDDCTMSTAKTKRLSEALRSTVDVFESTARLSAILESAPQPTEISEANWDTIITSWDDVKNKLASVKVVDSVKPIRAAAVSVSSSIHSSVTQVVQASAAKDKGKYESASGMLADSFATIPNITTVSRDVTQKNVDILKKVYSETFE